MAFHTSKYAVLPPPLAQVFEGIQYDPASALATFPLPASGSMAGRPNLLGGTTCRLVWGANQSPLSFPSDPHKWALVGHQEEQVVLVNRWGHGGSRGAVLRRRSALAPAIVGCFHPQCPSTSTG